MTNARRRLDIEEEKEEERGRGKERKEGRGKEERQTLVDKVFALYNLARARGKAYETAFKYYIPNIKRKNRIPLDRLLRLFSAYYKAEGHGQRLSLEQLEDTSDIFYVRCNEILKRAGLSPMYGARPRIEKEKIAALERAYTHKDVPFNASTLCYFLKINRMTASKILNKIHQPHEKVRKSHPSYLKQFRREREYITYQHLSQIYETFDYGFTKSSDLVDITGRNERVVAYALMQRPLYEPQLVAALRVLTNNEGHNTPYIAP